MWTRGGASRLVRVGGTGMMSSAGVVRSAELMGSAGCSRRGQDGGWSQSGYHEREDT